MSAPFEAIVELCRLAVTKQLVDANLRLRISASLEVHRLVALAEQIRQPTVFSGGTEEFRAIDTLEAGTTIELFFSGITTNRFFFATDLKELLEAQQGIFLYRSPDEYFLLSENYSSNEGNAPPIVDAYKRVPLFLDLIKQVADVTLNEGTRLPTFVLLAAKRLDIKPTYVYEDLPNIPDGEGIGQFAAEVRAAPFIDVKATIFKKVALRFLEATSTGNRLAELAKKFDLIRQAFLADLNLYVTEFNFEKVREGFEQKKLTFVLQLNASTADLLTKLLAIPIGQGLVVSQLKVDASASIGNVALLIGAIVFAVIAVLIILNQYHSLQQIKAEIGFEKQALASRFPQLHTRLSDMFGVLQRRARLHTVWFPLSVGVLLAASTTFTGYAFTRVPPGDRWVARAESIIDGWTQAPAKQPQQKPVP